MKSCLAIVCLLLAACALRPRHAAVPQGLESFPRGWSAEAVILLADSTFWTLRAAAEGNALDCRTVSWYRVNRRNPSLLQDMVFFDDETTEKPPEIRIDSWYDDGSTFATDGAALPRERSRIHGTFSSNGFERILRLPRYQEGQIIRVETRRHVFRPEYRSREFLRGDHPCARRYVSFRYPEGAAPRLGVRNGEGLPLVLDTVRAGGFTEIRVAASELSRMRPFSRSRYPEEWHAALHFTVPARGSEPPDWRTLGDHYLAMIQPSLAPSPEVAALAASLPDTAAGADSVAAAAFALVQGRIRYLADVEALNAYVPRPPAQVLANGYGDCKEMATLMRALLQAKGLAAGLALVRTGGPQLLADFPSLAPFDHVVLWRRAVDGTVRFHDPTVAGADAGNSYLPLLGQKVLLLSPGAGALDTVKPAPGYRNRAYTRSQLIPGRGAQPWMLRGEVSLKGKAAFDLNLALRNRFQAREEARGAVWSFLSSDFGIRAVEWDWHSPAADSLVVTYAMPAQRMAVKLGGEGVKLDVPALMGMASVDMDFDGHRLLQGFEQEDEWTLPRGYQKLQRRNLRQDAAAGEWAVRGERISRNFRCPPKVWKAEEKHGLRRFLGAVSEFSLAAVWR